MKRQQGQRAHNLVSCSGGHLFQIIDGQRVWVSDPPASYLQDAAADAAGDRQGVR